MPIKTSAETWHTTTDGVRYQDKDKAIRHQAITDRVDLAMRSLKPIPKDDGCRFANGHGYVQQTEEAVRAVRAKLWELTGEIEHMREWLGRQASDAWNTCHPSWPLRLLDGSHHALERAWGRVACIDHSTWREYGQSYYAANPDQADGGEIAT